MQLEARLRAFAAVARTRSFSGAAQEIHVSQPAVSKHVAALEAQLGRRLFERRRGGLELTPAGDALVAYVLPAEALLANARRALDSLDDHEAGEVSIAASGIPADYLLPALLARFSMRHPRIAVSVAASTSEEALRRVRAHDVELAVVGGFTVPADLKIEPLLDDEIVLIGPAELAGRRVRPADLQGRWWVTREEGSATRAAVETARWELGLQDVRTLEAPSWEAVKRMVEAGAGVAAISKLAVDREGHSRAFAVLDVPRWRLRRTLSIVTARDVPLTPPAELLRDALLELRAADL